MYNTNRIKARLMAAFPATMIFQFRTNMVNIQVFGKIDRK